jgi:hypothetical protein
VLFHLPRADLVVVSPMAALRQIRYYFEAGKPEFPPLALANAALWLALAYLDPGMCASISLGLSKCAGYVPAAAGVVLILPFTALYIVPVTNDRILELDDLARREGDIGLRGKKAQVRAHVADFEREN